MRTTSLLAAASALALIAGAAEAQTPSEREAGFALDAYLAPTQVNLDEDTYEEGALVRMQDADWSSVNFGGAAMYRHGLGDNVVVGAGVFLEGYSGDHTQRDEEVVIDPGDEEDPEITRRETEQVSLDTAYGVRVMAGYALDDMPVLIYASAGYGWVGIEKVRKFGTTVGTYNTTTPFSEIAAGAEYDFAPGAAVFVEVAHRDITDATIQYEKASNFGDFSGDSQQARFGVRFHF